MMLMMQIAGGVLTSLMVRGMLAVIASLFVITILGLVYPALKNRSPTPAVATLEGRKSREGVLGTREMSHQLDAMMARGDFGMGIILGYRSLRRLMPKMEEEAHLKQLTENEILAKVLKGSPELSNISSHLIRAYRHYERVRFGLNTDAKDLDSMKSIMEEVYRLNMVLRARASREAG